MEKKKKTGAATVPLEQLIDFPKLFLMLSSLGMKETSVRELTKSDNVRLLAPRSIVGREKIFIFSLHGMEVIVCTTWDVTTQKPRPRGSDAGWVLIRYKGKVKYFARPVRRTKSFAHHLYWRARIAIERITARPKDTFSGNFMLLEKGKYLFQRYWVSMRPDPKTGRFEKQSFNQGLSDESLDYKKKIDKARRKYAKKLKAQGKSPGKAMLRRKKWKSFELEPLITHFN